MIRKFPKLKRLAADYPPEFVESVIRNFENDKIESFEDDYISPGFFDIAQLVITVEAPFCTKKEASLKRFMRQFNNFTNYGLNGQPGKQTLFLN